MMRYTIIDKTAHQDSSIHVVNHDLSYIKHIKEAYINPQIEVDRYKISGRPMIDMSTNLVIAGHYLPVIRYENLYYSPDKELEKQKSEDQLYQGRFYFYEPETAYHLHLGKFLVAANKYDAMRKLEHLLYGPFNEFDDMLKGQTPHIPSVYFLARIADITTKCITGGSFSIESIIMTSDEHKGFFDTVPNKLSYNVSAFEKQLSAILDISVLYEGRNRDQFKNYLDYVHLNRAMYAVKEMSKIASDLAKIAETDKELKDINTTIYSNLSIPLIGGNINIETDMVYNDIVFGKSDILDQPLVKYGRKCGYDTIILQREVGSYRTVTEVLDLRPKDTTNVMYLDEYIDDGNIKEYPLIWTPADGIVQIE